MALGVLDQQTSNSPVTIRWGADDLAYADVAGVRLALDRADASVSIQIAEGAYEPHVEATLDRLLAPGDVFVDVGANVGYHTVRAARSVGPTRPGRGGRGESGERPPDRAHDRAERASRTSSWCRWHLSSSSGHVVFGTHVGSNGGFLDAVVVGVRARDARADVRARTTSGSNGVSVVKIDVEGAEALVIDGATEVIRRDRPSFVMGCSQEIPAACRNATLA